MTISVFGYCQHVFFVLETFGNTLFSVLLFTGKYKIEYRAQRRKTKGEKKEAEERMQSNKKQIIAMINCRRKKNTAKIKYFS